MEDTSLLKLTLLNSSEDVSIVKSEIDGIECNVIGIPERDEKGNLIVIPLFIDINDEILSKIKYKKS